MKPLPEKLLGHIKLKFASVSTKLSPWVHIKVSILSFEDKNSNRVVVPNMLGCNLEIFK